MWAQTAVTIPSAAPAAAVFPLATKPAPKKLDQALRERVMQFLQFTVDHSYSKAYELVASETKDWYLSSGKAPYTAFKIEGIDYAKDYKQANVRARVTRVLTMNGREVPTDIVITDLWKLEGGKWMWYHDPNVLVTPFGEIKFDRSKMSAHAGPAPIPSDLSLSAAEQAASKVGQEISTDKQELLFEQGTPGSEELVFHNGLQGIVDVEIDIVGDYVAFSVEPRHVQVQSGKDLTLKVSYKPSSNSISSVVRLTIEPFQREVKIPLKFKPAAP